MAKSKSKMPVRKVTVGAIGGAASIVIVWFLQQFFKVQVPAEVSSAFTTVFTFVVSYMTPPAGMD